jgi:hypothetical protein
LTALATFTALTSAALAAVSLDVARIHDGAALSVLALGTLGVAARLSIAVAGLAPRCRVRSIAQKMIPPGDAAGGHARDSLTDS